MPKSRQQIRAAYVSAESAAQQQTQNGKKLSIVWGENNQFSDTGMAARQGQDVVIYYGVPDNKGETFDRLSGLEVRDDKLMWGGCEIHDAESGAPITSLDDIPSVA